MKAKQNARFSIIYLMFGTTVIAVFCAALFNESQWWRATLGTISMALILNSLLAAIYSRGERRVFSLSYFLGAVFFVPGMYTYMASLPYLITINLMDLLGVLAGPRRGNFMVVATIFWLQLTCLSSGFIGLRWYRKTKQESNTELPQAVQSNDHGL